MSKKISELPAATTLTNDDELVVNHVDTSGQEPETITSKMTVSNLKSQLGINGKAEKAIGATSGNVATLDSDGNPVDSGKTLEKSVPANAEFTDTQSDWNESDSSKKDYIKNKPTYVGSFNGRTGAVFPAAGDYNFTQVTGARGIYGVTAIARGANLNNYIYPTYAGEYLYDTYGSYSGAQNISNIPTGTSGFPFRLIVESLSNDEGTIPIDDEIPTALSNETLQTIICTDPTNKIILTYKRARIDGTWTSWERQGAQDISGKADISAIGYNETGSTCSKSGGYSTGDNFYKDGKFCTAIATIAQGATFTENTNYVKGTIADAIKSLNSGLTKQYTLINTVTITLSDPLADTSRDRRYQAYSITNVNANISNYSKIRLVLHTDVESGAKEQFLAISDYDAIDDKRSQYYVSFTLPATSSSTPFLLFLSGNADVNSSGNSYIMTTMQIRASYDNHLFNNGEYKFSVYGLLKN